MRKEKNRGITLIALIITIIIMLILVAVSINIAIKSGLFEAAGKAVKDTKIAQDSEQKLAGGMINVEGKMYASIDDYLAGKEYVHEHTWSEWVITKEATETESGEKERTCSECKTKEKMTYVKNLIIGAPIDYHEYIGEDGNALSTMPSYTSPKEKTGHTENQEFTVTNNSGIEWIVLGEENGQIKITTKNVIKTKDAKSYYLSEKTGYANYVEELNKIGSIYGKGKYADTGKYSINIDETEERTGGRSFQMEDLGYETCTRTAAYTYARHNNGYIYRYEAGTEPDGTSITGGNYSNFEYMNLDVNPSKTEATEEEDKEWGELSASNPYVTVYQYNYPGRRTLSTTVSKADTAYLLASRSVNFDADNVYFGIRYVDNSGNVNGVSWCQSYGHSGDSTSCPCRAVVYLKSDVKLTYNASKRIYN